MTDKPQKIAFITPYPYDIAPSQRFRFEQYYKTIEQANLKYKQFPFFNNKAYQLLYLPNKQILKFLFVGIGFIKRFLLLFQLSNYNFIFIHREASPIGPPIFEFVIAKILKKRIIYDFDDAIWLPNTSKNNTIISWLKFHNKVKWICKWAYKISCGNSYLCNYAKQFNQNVYLIPTTIDTNNWHNQLKMQATKNIVIGWTGSHTTLPYLKSIVPILQKLEQYNNFTFQVIANEDPHIALQSYKFVQWKKETEIEDLLKLNIGIMPMPENQWTKGKCGFKALQYMALGIPAVVSPVGVNKDIVSHGVDGFLCHTNQEWENALSSLIKNETQRTNMGKKARTKVEEHFSTKAITPKFIKLFELT